MVTAPEKTPILEKMPDSRTAHLQPLIDFLKAQGNPPWVFPSYRRAGADGFDFDRDGFGNFYFQVPLDLAAVRRHFSLPPTIVFTKSSIWDQRNMVGIDQALPVGEPLKFNL